MCNSQKLAKLMDVIVYTNTLDDRREYDLDDLQKAYGINLEMATVLSILIGVEIHRMEIKTKKEYDPMEAIKNHFFDYVKNETGDELNDGEITRWILDYIGYLEEKSVHQPDDAWTEFMNHKIKEELK